jgi:hypothetical protein
MGQKHKNYPAANYKYARKRLMNILVPIMMFGWIPVVISLFSKLTPRRAVIASFLFAWMFLPMAEYPVPGLPDYTKMSATCWGVLIAALMFDSISIFSFRLKSIDIPMIIWCLCPILSSLTNDLGIYDGISESLAQTVTWGFPYFIGRIYFNNLESLKEFAIGIFIGGLIYMPLCWFEIRFSPQLHKIFYGYYQRAFVQTMRYGGFRPMVFMEHGLMVGIWMISSTLIGLWIWVSGILKKVKGIPISILVIMLLITSILCKSTGAIALFIIGTGILLITKKIKMNIMLICLMLISVLYVSTRATGYWDGENLTMFIYEQDQERAQSLWTRFDNENMLIEKALEKKTFGWGGWGRSRIYDEEGEDITITDGLWIIVFGKNGMLGLAALMSSILFPMVILMKQYNPMELFHPKVIPATLLSVLLSLYMVDCLLNAMVNPIFMVAAGGITGIGKEALDEKAIMKIPTIEILGKMIYQPRFL